MFYAYLIVIKVIYNQLIEFLYKKSDNIINNEVLMKLCCWSVISWVSLDFAVL